MLMSLGMFVFELPAATFQELDRQTEWRHSQNERFHQRAANQFLGPGEDTRTLAGTIPIEIGNPDALETLREMADTGESYPLVDARGRVHGAHVITSLSVREKHHLADATPRITEFTLQLRHVDDDSGQAGALPTSAGSAWF